MTRAAAPADAFDDVFERAFGGACDAALLALRLFLLSPAMLGGLCLKGPGPARDGLLEILKLDMGGGHKVRRLPLHIDDERLLGGVDIAASLAAGRTVRCGGLLTECEGDVIVVPMAERLPDAVAGRLAQAMDRAVPTARFGLILLDDGRSGEEQAPSSLLERVAFICDPGHAGGVEMTVPEKRAAIPVAAVRLPEEEALRSLATTSAALGIASSRPMIFALEAARSHAALHGRQDVSQIDLEVAARLVLAPRAVQLPAVDDRPVEPPPSSQREQQNDGEGETGAGPLDDVVLGAALAAIPADLLAKLSDGKSQRRAQGSGSGRRRPSGRRGKPLGARPGLPRGGARLALIDTLRAAVPLQPLRRRQASVRTGQALILHKDDLRIRRFEERAGKVSIFCVDASGSAAAARLAEAKGAVELMLAQAYATRSEVAMLAFRGLGAELVLPPTRSLTRARRALAELPGGGGTPLAAGLRLARETAENVEMRGRTAQLILLTDGRANIAGDGTPGRRRANEEAEIEAKVIASSGIEALVVDISARTRPDAPHLAAIMQAKFLALPMADARRLHEAVAAVIPSSRAP